MRAQQRDGYDVIVVGSGAAGGMCAYVLACSGARVLMLEAGRDYDPVSETPMFQLPMDAPLRGAGTAEKPFWGGFSMIAGILGTLIGFIIAAQSIEAAGEVQTTLVWGGIKIAMLSSAFGTLMMAGAALVWFVLQLRWRLLEANEAEATV